MENKYRNTAYCNSPDYNLQRKKFYQEQTIVCPQHGMVNIPFEPYDLPNTSTEYIDVLKNRNIYRNNYDEDTDQSCTSCTNTNLTSFPVIDTNDENTSYYEDTDNEYDCNEDQCCYHDTNYVDYDTEKSIDSKSYVYKKKFVDTFQQISQNKIAVVNNKKINLSNNFYYEKQCKMQNTLNKKIEIPSKEYVVQNAYKLKYSEVQKLNENNTYEVDTVSLNSLHSASFVEEYSTNYLYHNANNCLSDIDEESVESNYNLEKKVLRCNISEPFSVAMSEEHGNNISKNDTNILPIENINTDETEVIFTNPAQNDMEKIENEMDEEEKNINPSDVSLFNKSKQINTIFQTKERMPRPTVCWKGGTYPLKSFTKQSSSPAQQTAKPRFFKKF